MLISDPVDLAIMSNVGRTAGSDSSSSSPSHFLPAGRLTGGGATGFAASTLVGFPFTSGSLSDSSARRAFNQPVSVPSGCKTLTPVRHSSAFFSKVDYFYVVIDQEQ